MKLLSHLIAAVFLILALPAHSQTVYRCGNSYSQIPCPGGNAVDASDSRTPEQRKAHEASVRHEKRSADRLENTRQREEAAAARAAEQADKAQRAADKAAQAKPNKQHTRERIPAYRAPDNAGQK